MLLMLDWKYPLRTAEWFTVYISNSIAWSTVVCKLISPAISPYHHYLDLINGLKIHEWFTASCFLLLCLCLATSSFCFPLACLFTIHLSFKIQLECHQFIEVFPQMVSSPNSTCTPACIHTTGKSGYWESLPWTLFMNWTYSNHRTYSCHFIILYHTSILRC